ncbi:MAG: hypothetical protein ACO20H_01225 [Bacteriovoracaceae bacterium]
MDDFNQNEQAQHKTDQSGQTLLEFVMLLVVVMTLSFVMLKGVNSAVADKWIAYVKVISWPSPSGIYFR